MSNQGRTLYRFNHNQELDDDEYIYLEEYIKELDELTVYDAGLINKISEF